MKNAYPLLARELRAWLAERGDDYAGHTADHRANPVARFLTGRYRPYRVAQFGSDYDLTWGYSLCIVREGYRTKYDVARAAAPRWAVAFIMRLNRLNYRSQRTRRVSGREALVVLNLVLSGRRQPWGDRELRDYVKRRLAK